MADVAIGEIVPDFEAITQTGESVKLSDYLLLYFWQHG